MSYYNDNEDYLIHRGSPVRTPKKKKFFIEDYKDVLHEVNPCPKCGKSPERNNCGPEYQAVDCYDCNIHASYDSEFECENGNKKLLSSIKNWNAGKFEKEFA